MIKFYTHSGQQPSANAMASSPNKRSDLGRTLALLESTACGCVNPIFADDAREGNYEPIVRLFS